MARRIVITSGKGGVGKSTIVSLLGYAMASLGKKVLLVDMDFGLNNLDVLMGIENKIVYDIIDVIEGRCLPKQAIIEDFLESNLSIFPSTHCFCKRKFGSNELMDIISQVEYMFDYVIIDCPAGIDGGFKRAVECGGEHIIVTTPHLSALRDADKVINVLSTNLNAKPNVIVNRARGDLMLDGKMLTISTISNFLGGQLLGVVPEDDAVAIQLYKGVSKYDESLSYKSILMIARSIVNGEGEVFDCTKKYKGLIGNIRKKIKRSV